MSNSFWQFVLSLWIFAIYVAIWFFFGDFFVVCVLGLCKAMIAKNTSLKLSTKLQKIQQNCEVSTTRRSCFVYKFLVVKQLPIQLFSEHKTWPPGHWNFWTLVESFRLVFFCFFFSHVDSCFEYTFCSYCYIKFICRFSTNTLLQLEQCITFLTK